MSGSAKITGLGRSWVRLYFFSHRCGPDSSRRCQNGRRRYMRLNRNSWGLRSSLSVAMMGNSGAELFKNEGSSVAAVLLIFHGVSWW